MRMRGVELGAGAPLACVPLMGADAGELAEGARRAVGAGAQVLEWRVDCFGGAPEAWADAAAAVRGQAPDVPLVATLRTRGQGGRFDGSGEQYARAVEALAKLGSADAVDVELAAGDDAVRALAAAVRGCGAAAIVSHHDFAGTPAADEMARILERESALGADIVKLAVMARGAADAAALAAAVEAAHVRQPVIALAMGEAGRITRLTGEAFGSVLTFCALDGQASAPGQVELGAARTALAALHAALGDGAQAAPDGQVRMEAPRAVQLVTLFGHPVAHSLSPAVHNASFAVLGLPAAYVCLDVPDDAALAAAVAAMRALPNWAGANLTMPCKRAVLPLLDGLDETARLMEAANVVVKRDGKLIGYNTDGAGFMRNLADHGAPVAGARLAVLGCGGAGSAVAVQAALDGARAVDLLVRGGGAGARRAAELAARLADAAPGCALRVVDTGDGPAFAEAVAAADIVANATPVGMGDARDETPVPAALLHAGQTVADAVYFPRETRLLREAAARGCATVPGLGMLVCQAAAGEALWFGADMDTARIERLLVEAGLA